MVCISFTQGGQPLNWFIFYEPKQIDVFIYRIVRNRVSTEFQKGRNAMLLLAINRGKVERGLFKSSHISFRNAYKYSAGYIHLYQVELYQAPGWRMGHISTFFLHDIINELWAKFMNFPLVICAENWLHQHPAQLAGSKRVGYCRYIAKDKFGQQLMMWSRHVFENVDPPTRSPTHFQRHELRLSCRCH